MRIVGLLHHTFSHFVIETEVEDGIHHTWHGSASTRTNRYKQRVLYITELAVHQFLDVSHCGIHFILKQFFDFLLPYLIILITAISSDCEAWRHWHTDEVHLSKVCTFTAESLAHLRITFCLSIAEGVNSFLSHNFSFLFFII